MEKYVDVMNRTLQLSETCLEALEYIQSKLNDGLMDETIPLMDDLVSGFYQIEKSIEVFSPVLPDNQLDRRITPLRNSTELVVSAYEQEDRGKAQERIQFNMLPGLKAMKAELETVLHPFVLS